jgi:hypothetical protein
VGNVDRPQFVQGLKISLLAEALPGGFQGPNGTMSRFDLSEYVEIGWTPALLFSFSGWSV